MFFMIPSGQNLADGFRDCLLHLRRLATDACADEAAIAVHTKRNVRGSAIEEVLGDYDTRQLLKGSVILPDIRLHLITEKNQSPLRRGPLIAAYVSSWFLVKLARESRFTDLIYLPWTQEDEVTFFRQFKPQILSAPLGWSPPQGEKIETDAHDENLEGQLGIRKSLTTEERALPLEHTIDPGFVNYRRIETIIGEKGCEAMNRAIARLPPMPEGLREVRLGHIYSTTMLAFCKVLEVPPLGKLLVEPSKGQIFCSTETVGPCRNIYAAERAVTEWRSPNRRSGKVEFHYSTAHISSDTLRSELRQGGTLSIIAELYSVDSDRMVFHPLVMGGPWLSSPDPRWETTAMWWGGEFYENVIEDFAEFSAVLSFPKPSSFEPMKDISEDAFKHCLTEILGGVAPKDWGGETSDFYSAHLRLAGRRVSGAFLLKGPARFSPMRLNNLGKNNDQIVRLASEPADVLFVQHCHEITPPVRSTLRAFAVQPSRARRYCLIDGRDSLWLLEAYGLYEKAVSLSRPKGRQIRR